MRAAMPLSLVMLCAGCGLFLDELGGPWEPCFTLGEPCDLGLVCNQDGLCEPGGVVGLRCLAEHECLDGACGLDDMCHPAVGRHGTPCRPDSSCDQGLLCIADGTCCLPDCSGKICGGDGCGGSCGACSASLACQSGACQPFLDWVFLQGATYTMGRDDLLSPCGYTRDHEPEHLVSVPSFYMSRTETTVLQYRACVEAGACEPITVSGLACNYSLADRDQHPVNCVEWQQARDFCAWAGGRLASEAEWEFAASNRGDGGTYPWDASCTNNSYQSASCTYCVYNEDYLEPDGCGLDRTWPVCSKTTGNTAQGLCDMAGNVEEWVEDLWHGLDTGYTGAPSDGSAWVTVTTETRRVTRGGSFRGSSSDIYVFDRNWESPDNYGRGLEELEHNGDHLGIRCVYR